MASLVTGLPEAAGSSVDQASIAGRNRTPSRQTVPQPFGEDDLSIRICDMLVDVPLAFAAGGAIGEVVFDKAGKVAGLALEFPYPRPRTPEQRRRQWEQGKRRGGFIFRNPEIDQLMRHPV